MNPKIKLLTFALLGLFLLSVPLLFSSFYTTLAIQALIFGIFAMSLDILVGYTALPSLGHAAYFGIAGYSSALFSMHITRHIVPGLLVGLGAAFILAVFFGLLALRTKGVYFLMITLALAQVVWAIAFKWRAVTGGSDGIPGVPRPVLISNEYNYLADTGPYYFVVLFLFIACFYLMKRFVHSPFGLALEGIRESESRMEALGFNIWWYKYTAFIFSGAFAGISGSLFIYFNQFVSASDLNLHLSGTVFLMVILGGSGTLYGPAIGALIIVFLEHLISAGTERWLLILGIIYVLVVMYMPDGIVGTLKRSFPLGDSES